MLLVRPASDADCGVIAELLAVLGYPATEADVRRRLPRLASDTSLVVVAELDHAVLGVATAHLFDALHTESRAAWLTALVVQSAAQRRGVGRALVRHVEAWIRERGCDHISVLTNVRRVDAHAFYESLDFLRTGHRYTKHFTTSE